MATPPRNSKWGRQLCQRDWLSSFMFLIRDEVLAKLTQRVIQIQIGEFDGYQVIEGLNF